MALVSLQDVKVAFGGPELIDGVTLQIERRERVCLVGRNGAGKSTLLKIIGREIIPDSGEVIREQGVRITLARPGSFRCISQEPSSMLSQRGSAVWLDCFQNTMQ